MKSDIAELISKLDNPVFANMSREQAFDLVEPGSRIYDAYYPALRAFAEHRGYPVNDTSEKPPHETSSPSETVEGVTYLRPHQKGIWIRPSLSPNHRFKTLLHEVAHVLSYDHVDELFPKDVQFGMMVDDRYAQQVFKGLGETHSETVDFLVSKALGFKNDYPQAYLAHGGGSNSGEYVEYVAPVAEKSAATILKVLGVQALAATA